MLNIIENFDLQSKNTFGVKAKARYFVEILTIEDLQELTGHEIFQKNKYLILGGGSNVLFLRDFQGLVIENSINGIEIIHEDSSSVEIKIMGGTNWHEAVMWSVDNNWWGMENLALIPGKAGAAPMQNIGAYGVEIKDILKSVEFVDLITGQLIQWPASKCQLAYRDSIFKHQLKNRAFITAITVVLSKNPKPVLHYGNLFELVNPNQNITPADVAKTIISIRQSKLPDPRQIGNAGSFFKNPVVDKNTFQRLSQTYPEMPYFEMEHQIKIPAAWLIEQCGWKGKIFENKFGVYPKQALVLVNYGGATGEEIFGLSQQIIDSVKEKFGIILEREVNVID
ncbi:MAG: UDP-N-acetylenolpyruvoylglucosamine reductase [Bacteroidia bacterium]|nr:MAG: UDP-N-acetylenolpyruvoylglucosamine reductase [Bacteroidia bacterium]